MKRIFVIAIVGVLSITSLAEAKSGSTETKPSTDQRSPSSSQLYCPDEFVMIEDKAKGDFCISKKVEERKDRSSAQSSCQNMKVPQKQSVTLCTWKELESACQKNLQKPVGLEAPRLIEQLWVGDSNDGYIAVLMGNSNCSSKGNNGGNSNLGGSRCCFSISGAE